MTSGSDQEKAGQASLIPRLLILPSKNSPFDRVHLSTFLHAFSASNIFETACPQIELIFTQTRMGSISEP